MIWWLALDSKKNSITKKQQHKNSPLLYTHTTQIKFKIDKVSISGPHGKGTQIFYKTIKSCVIEDFIVEDLCFACIV